MNTTNTPPLTASQRVMRANKRLVDAGGRRMPAGYLQPSEAQALADLVAAGYAASPLAAIKTALLDAHRKISRAKK